ncbi:MAG: DUF2336 domain-containing protein [bacterium]
MAQAYSESLIQDSLSNQEGESHATSSVRLQLLHKLTDLVILPNGKLSPNERSFIADMMIETLEHVSADAKCQTATRLAGFIDIPTSLLRYLLLEDIDTATIILENATTIPEYMLLEACGRSPKHRLKISLRDDITDAIADVLIHSDEAKVIHALLKREELTLSERAIAALVSRSQHDESIREILLKRLELRIEHGLAMFWWCGPKSRRQILSRFSIDRGVVQDVMQNLFREVYTDPNPDDFVKKMLHIIDRRHRPRGRNGEIVTMEIVERTLKVAQMTPTDELAEAVGLLAGIQAETARIILTDPGREAFAVLCKSIGLPRASFEALFHNTEGLSEFVQYTGEQVDELMLVFDGIARDYSRAILRYWDWKPIIAVSDLNSTLIDPPESTNVGYFGAI